jgi:hypothetical protein
VLSLNVVSEKVEREVNVKKLMLLLLVAAVFAANSVMTSGIPYHAHPYPPAPQELYWDDGIMSSGWAWYTGGNYWAVQFDDEKTHGETGVVYEYGAVTCPDWPDGSFQGVYIHTFSDLGGYPGADLGYEFLKFTAGGVFQWIDADPIIHLTTSVFYVAFQQIGNYPFCDSMAVDAVSGTHNWMGNQGSWAPTTTHGDFMLRCYWDAQWGVEETSWGAVKALY